MSIVYCWLLLLLLCDNHSIHILTTTTYLATKMATISIELFNASKVKWN